MDKSIDATFKELIDRHADDWLALVAPCVGLPPGLHAEPADADLSTFSLQADKLFRLFKGKKPRGVLHLELQSTWQDRLPARTAAHNVLASHRLEADVYSVIVLLAKRANASAIDGLYRRTFPDGRPCLEFHYGVIRAWELSAEEMLAGPVGTLPLALLTDDARANLPGVVGRYQDRLDRDVADEQHREALRTAGGILLGPNYDKAMIKSILRETSKMTESTYYQGIIEEGIAKGELSGRLTTIRLVGTKRFGRPSAKVKATLAGIADPDRLDRIAERLVEAADWADLLATA